MNILIIGDVHGRKFWESAVTQYSSECDKVIFLGDYLDPYQQFENITRKEAIENFEKIIKFKQDNKEKVILLLGNHDIQYITKRFNTRSRYDSSNGFSISRRFNENLSLFQLVYETMVGDKRYLFSHAGLMNSFVERNKEVIGEPTLENLNILLHSHRGLDVLCELSQYRSWNKFAPPTGSFVWSDVNEKIDNPEDSCVKLYDYQIFGHTMQEVGEPIITDKWACLDCQKAFILNENNKLTMVH